MYVRPIYHASNLPVWELRSQGPHSAKGRRRFCGPLPDPSLRPSPYRPKTTPLHKVQVPLTLVGRSKHGGGYEVLVHPRDPTYHVVLPNGAWDECRERVVHFHDM